MAPDNYRGYSNLAAIYQFQGRYSEAIPLLQRALAIQPSADAYTNLGTMYFYLRRFPESANAFAEAVKLNERDYELWGDLADVEVRIPEKQTDSVVTYKKAIALADQELQINPQDVRILQNLADYYSMLGDQAHSLAYLQRALSLQPDDPAVRYKAAQVYTQLGHKEVAVQWLAKALETGYSPIVVRDSPALDNLRSDPRVKNMIQAMQRNHKD